jgi:CRP/FNR family cyclic AMP-dependent transcriptional regulator
MTTQRSAPRPAKLSPARQSAASAVAPAGSALADALGSSLWARAMPAPARVRLAAEIAERQVPSGGYVVRKGAPVEAWIGVVDGLVKIATETRGGKTISFAGIPTGAWFGEGSVLKDATWRYDAIALRPSRIAFMPRATFLRLLDTDLAFNRFLIEQLNERLAQFIGQVEHDRLLPPQARVARCLAALANPRLIPVVGASFAISQEEIGYLCGLARQTVNRALKRLEDARLLRVEYGRVHILDLDGLRRFEG